MNFHLFTFQEKYEASLEDKGGRIRRGFMTLVGHNEIIEYLLAQGVIIDTDDAEPLYIDYVQRHLDSVAQSRGYDNILSLCTYATSSVPSFQAEGQAGVDFRDVVWDYCITALGEVKDELRTLPTPDELIAELPTIIW